MKSLIKLFTMVLNENGTICHVSTTQDLKRALGRIEHEGISFLTITLANFGKDFERSLDQGFVSPQHFAGFQRRGGLPLFLRGFLEQVFDSKTGALVDNPPIETIRCLRQLLLMWAKIEIPCTENRVWKALEGYVNCERDVRRYDDWLSQNSLDDFRRVCRLLWTEMFTKMDEVIYNGNISPRHGPGATADRLMGNQKWYSRYWTSRLDEVFPHMDYLFHRYGAALADSEVHITEPGAEIPAKVITVPKTLKTPRIIAMEPSSMQFMQQGLHSLIVETLGEFPAQNRLIGYSSQEPNRALAKEGSITGDLATLDLSEASDRVSNQLVLAMMQDHPWLSKAVQATRSRNADVLGFGVIPLAKFASMGSALCFPIEAMVFCTIVFIGIEKSLGTRLSRGILNSLVGKVRVYGDDIIVPTDYALSVAESLETFGLKVNQSKSFWTGKFRESCGADFYDGEDVTVARVRRNFPQTRKDAAEIESLSSLRNQLYERGYWSIVRWLDTEIEKLIPYPAVLPTSPAVGKVSFLGYQTDRIDPFLQRPMVKGVRMVARLPRNEIDGYDALNKWFRTQDRKPEDLDRFGYENNPLSSDHLLRSGRPASSDIKYGWFVPF